MTESTVIDGILRREGGWRNEAVRPDGSIDPPTYRGITAKTLGAWRRLGRQATRAELLAMPESETRAIYRHMYIEEPGFVSDTIPYEPLRVQLIDYGVNSGPALAIRWLQRVLGVEADGALGPRTYAALRRVIEAGYASLLNDALVAARLYMIDRAVDSGTMRKADEEGVESRALEFFIARPTAAQTAPVDRRA